MSENASRSPEKSLGIALRRRAGAIAAQAAAERRAVRAEAKCELLETLLVDVWRWTNDGHPHLELLIPMLKKADSDYAALVALQELEDALPEVKV